MPRDLLPRSLPAAVLQRLADRDIDLAAVAVMSGGARVEGRRGAIDHGVAMRKAEDGAIGLTGYAASWGTSYDVAGGPAAGGWTETVAAGAVTKSLQERDDVRFLINHEGLPLARTKSGTMSLAADDLGLLVQVDSLDLVNPRAQELVSALERRDVDQMSWAFRVIRQEWNGDYTERQILEAQIFDVSAVTFPANPATIIGVRSAEAEPASRMTLTYAAALAAALEL